jgi:hypothetical protein
MSKAHTMAQRDAISKAITAIKSTPEPIQLKLREAMIGVLETQSWDDYTHDITAQQEKAENALAKISEITGVTVKLEMPEEHFRAAMHEAFTKAFKHGTPSEVSDLLLHHSCYSSAKTLCEVYRSI